MADLADLFPGYESHWIDTSAGRLFARSGGKGPPLLLLHGYPQTNVMWHGIAPLLHDHFTLVVPDLPGYGWLAVPKADESHAPYDKRSMAGAMVELMEKLGYVQFALVGHDRGARVGYRLALDQPGRLSKLCVIDVIPTFEMWQRMDARLAMKVWLWPFLAQPAPLPEDAIGARPIEFTHMWTARLTKAMDLSGFDPRALAHYDAFISDPLRIHATCEDYRAGATTDVENDRKDREAGRKINCPVLALWGAAGVPNDSGPLPIWHEWCVNVRGHPIDAGHFVPEENPQATAAALLEFLR